MEPVSLVAKLCPEAASQLSTPYNGLPHAVHGAVPAAAAEAQWYAVYTWSRQEKFVAEHLKHRSIEYFLPLYDAVHRWKDRYMRLQLPLFPGYLFVRIPLAERVKVLQVAAVVHIVGAGGRPLPLPQAEIEIIRTFVQRVKAEPYPYLAKGSRVRVRSGPLQGLEGVVVRHNGKLRIVISIELIMRSVALEVDARDLEPVR
jgi:transcription antitermination factor NusG